MMGQELTQRWDGMCTFTWIALEVARAQMCQEEPGTEVVQGQPPLAAQVCHLGAVGQLAWGLCHLLHIITCLWYQGRMRQLSFLSLPGAVQAQCWG